MHYVLKVDDIGYNNTSNRMKHSDIQAIFVSLPFHPQHSLTLLFLLSEYRNLPLKHDCDMVWQMEGL